MLEDLNTKQLSEGLNTDGNRFREYRYDEYAQFKQRLNPAPGFGNPDLKLTGAFHSSINASYQAGVLAMKSALQGTSKVEQLEQWYGEEKIYGITEENRRIHVEENIVPVLKDEIETITGLTYEL